MNIQIKIPREEIQDWEFLPTRFCANCGSKGLWRQRRSGFFLNSESAICLACENEVGSGVYEHMHADSVKTAQMIREASKPIEGSGEA